MSLRLALMTSTLILTFIAWGSAAYLSSRDTKSEIDKLFDAHLAESATALMSHAEHERREMSARGDDDTDAEESLGSNQPHYDDLDDDHDSLDEIRGMGRIFEKRLVFQVWNSNGRMLFASRKDLTAERMSKVQEGYSTVTTPAGELRVFSAWNSARTLNVQIGESTDARSSLADKSARSVIAPILFMIIPLMVLLAAVIELVLRPVRRISFEVSRRTPDDLSPIEVASLPKEIRPTVVALNALFERLARALENERRFTSDAAHELRTPLAAIKVQAQVAAREKDDVLRQRALDNVMKGVDRATHLVEQLLTLARLDPETNVHNEVVHLRPLIMESIQGMAALALARSIELELVDGEDCQVQGSRSMLEILARNLIDNAIRYTPQGGAVWVQIDQDDQEVRLVVEDSGPGLTDTQKDFIGKRFSRINRPSGDGAGLGLSIVDRIARLNHASLHFQNRPGGKGLAARIVFPKVKS